ncbi:MAG: hypothetical protein ACTSQ7_15465, partial [Alphaproteobacteria bacterium]
VNAFYVRVGQRLVAAAREAGADDGFARSRPSCPARLAPSGAMCHSIPHFQDIALMGWKVIIPSMFGEAGQTADRGMGPNMMEQKYAT